jgi:hypothetical protein
VEALGHRRRRPAAFRGVARLDPLAALAATKHLTEGDVHLGCR